MVSLGAMQVSPSQKATLLEKEEISLHQPINSSELRSKQAVVGILRIPLDVIAERWRLPRANHGLIN